MTDSEKKQQVKESAEKILEGKLGWTAFTTWAKQHYKCTHYKANQLWNRAWEHINKDTDTKIAYSAQAAFVELEDLKQWAIENQDRRVYLDAIKYQGKINKLEESGQSISVTQGDNKIEIKWGGEDE